MAPITSSIQFFKADISYQIRSVNSLRLWLSEVAQSEGRIVQDLNIILCSDEYLYKMNVDYLKHRTYTDIITFDQGTTKKSISGELYIKGEKVNLKNPRTLEKLREYHYDRVVIIYTYFVIFI